MDVDMPDEITKEDDDHNGHGHDYDNQDQSEEIPAEIGTGQSDFEESGEDETEDDDMYSHEGNIILREQVHLI